MENKYVDFAVASYALVDVIIALSNLNITFVVTREDSDLHIRFDENEVYCKTPTLDDFDLRRKEYLQKQTMATQEKLK